MRLAYSVVLPVLLQSRHDRVYDAWYTSYTIGVRALFKRRYFFSDGVLQLRNYLEGVIVGVSFVVSFDICVST